MKVARTIPKQYFGIKYPRWKQRAVGLAKHRIGTHNVVEILAESKKDGKRYYPDKYYISGEDINAGIRDKLYEVQTLPSGMVLVVVPISHLEVLEEEES